MSPLNEYLTRSAAAAEFKQDLRAYGTGTASERLEVAGHLPRVKVERVVTQLLASAPDLVVERLRLTGRSGCSDLTGDVLVTTPEGTVHFQFVWCCAWRATQEGWFDYFGFPDQTRAAREFGFDCFKRWERVS